MSGTYPSSPIPISVVIRSVQPSYVSVSHALTVQRRTRNAQRFAIELIYPPVASWDSFAPLWAFLLAQKGRAESFTYTLPVAIMPARGTWSGTPLVNGASQTGESIDLDGFTPSDTGVAKAGDLIWFGSGKKVYTVTADADANISGEAAVSIQPALVVSPGDGDAVSVHKSTGGIDFTMSLSAEDLSLPLQHCIRYGIQVELAEVID